MNHGSLLFVERDSGHDDVNYYISPTDCKRGLFPIEAPVIKATFFMPFSPCSTTMVQDNGRHGCNHGVAMRDQKKYS